MDPCISAWIVRCCSIGNNRWHAVILRDQFISLYSIDLICIGHLEYRSGVLNLCIIFPLPNNFFPMLRIYMSNSFIKDETDRELFSRITIQVIMDLPAFPLWIPFSIVDLAFPSFHKMSYWKLAHGLAAGMQVCLPKIFKSVQLLLI